MDLLEKLWTTEFIYSGKTIIAFLVFNILFMLMGRFRFCFITSLLLVYYSVLFENRALFERMISTFGDLGFFASNIIFGVVFLGLSVWSFFIDSD